jgi:GTP 3',8-cyclase
VLKDAYNRTIKDLRISLTDRCNFRCFYCLPHGEPAWAKREKLLSYEEIELAAEVFVDLGIEKIRLTGGEPLIRRDVPVLVEKLARLKPRLRDIALTTNGFDLARHAPALRDAGLDRITISLDSLRPDRFKEITGVDALGRVLEAVEIAKNTGFDPVKINAVIVRGHNDDEVVDLARFARKKAVSVRFIEFMPLDSGHDWSRDMVVSGNEIREAIEAVYPLKLINNDRGSETAWKYVFADGSPGEIGIIAPVTEMFCGQCSRIRLTADGQIRTCLFSTSEHDLRGVIRSGSDRKVIEAFVRSVVLQKEPRHHINDPEFIQPERTMSFIGG